MSSGTIQQSGAALFQNAIINTSKGILGQTMQVAASADFSIDPQINDLSGHNGQYYSVYAIDVIGNPTVRIVTLPDTTKLINGWKCRFCHLSGAPISICSYTNIAVAQLYENFSVELILINSAWYPMYSLPPSLLQGAVVTYGQNGNPTIAPASNNLSIGQFTAKTNKAINVNSTNVVAIQWNDQVIIDGLYYINDVNTGVITVNNSGRYRISAVVGVNLSGSATIGNFTVRLRVNGTFINAFVTQSTTSSYANYVFAAKSIHTITAPSTIDVVCNRTPASAGSITTISKDGCWLRIKYL
jgi:hypothetical protein